MRKLGEVLRLSLEQKLSVRKVARSCGLARSTVSDYLTRAHAAGLGWPLPEGMAEEHLDALLFPVRECLSAPRAQPDLIYMRNEMRGPHVTLQLLWEEYRVHTPEGYSYSQYCQLYRDWLGKQAVSLRQEHRAGEKLFVDYAGDTIPIIDAETGMVTRGHLFVAVLGCSNYTYAEVTPTEQLPDWIGAHVRSLEFIRGVPLVVVPDNTKTAVKNPCRYDPDINLTYQELAEHYGFAVIPARSRRPKDKAKVEGGVLIAERWILAALRHHMFFSLGEVNAAVGRLLTRLNDHPFKKLPGCRRDVFERMERPVLKPLPERRYELAEWKGDIGVNVDYHVEIDGHYYSVPFGLIKRRVSARYTQASVECFHKSQRVAVHARSFLKGRHTTLPEHRPPAHQQHLAWTPERIESWAATIGPHCRAAAHQIMASRPLPEHGFRPCLGLIRLGKRYSNARVNQACGRAIKLNIVGYRHIENMLKSGRDRLPLPEAQPAPVIVAHDNVRGAEYYQ
ncbi:MAG: IS21 family transposase [Chloroflexi bacterium]|nr:IS21 family transposase [Chloroflexota bacterium]